MNYDAWAETVNDSVRLALRAPLLHRDGNGTLYVNYDPKITEILREAKYFERIGKEFDAEETYPLPQGAKDLLRRKNDIRLTKIKMEDVLDRFNSQKGRIPPIFMPLLENHIKKVRLGINRGLIDIAWNSLIHERYFTGVSNDLNELTSIIDEIIDLKEQRIDTLLNDLADLELISLPTNRTFKVRALF